MGFDCEGHCDNIRKLLIVVYNNLLECDIHPTKCTPRGHCGIEIFSFSGQVVIYVLMP